MAALQHQEGRAQQIGAFSSLLPKQTNMDAVINNLESILNEPYVIDIPIINLPMIDDDVWQELARRNAVDNYHKAFNREPESIEEAVKWQRNKVRRERDYH